MNKHCFRSIIPEKCCHACANIVYPCGFAVNKCKIKANYMIDADGVLVAHAIGTHTVCDLFVKREGVIK